MSWPYFRPVGIVAVDAGADPVLRAVAPLGLASAAGCALVIDVDPEPTPYPSQRTLADLANDGPRRDELPPPIRGVAVLASGGIGLSAAADTIALLSSKWPLIVLATRLPVSHPTVVVRALLPGFLYEMAPAIVWQRVAGGPRPPAGTLALPILSRKHICQLLTGRVDRHWRWVREWKRVWESL